MQRRTKRLSKNKIKNHQDIHAKTYNDRNSKPQQKHHLGTVSKRLLRGVGEASIDFTWPQPVPLVLPRYMSRDRTSVGHGDDGLDAITSNQRINTTLCKIKTSMYLKSKKKKL